MTMTTEEEKVLLNWSNKNVAVGTILYPVVILCRVVLKMAMSKRAQEQPTDIKP